MDNSNRPCSPHLQIYALPLTARLSIPHRFTGMLLSVGLVLFAVALLLIKTTPDACSEVQLFLAAIPAKIGLGIFLYTLFLHWCHGMRHLLMDTGKSLQKSTMTRYAWLEIVLSLLLTIVAAVYIWMG